MTTLDFLQEIYRGCESGYLTIWSRQDKKTAWFEVSQLEAAISYAQQQNADKDVYFGIGLRKEKLDSAHRGDNTDVSVLTCFWMDVDIAGPNHVQANLPATLEEALDLVDMPGLKSSIIVHSGGGIHAYWLFEKPIVIATSAHFENVSKTIKGFQEEIIKHAHSKGFKLDSTFDLARVLRLPETINQKNQTKSKVFQSNDIRYSPADFSRFKAAAEAVHNAGSYGNSDSNAGRFEMPGIITGSGERILEKCVFMQYCRDFATTLPEPYWHVLITNMALAKDGKELCHRLSKPYPSYNQLETERKINRAISEHKPHTCEYIKNSLCFEGCDNACTVKAPISYTIITKAEQVSEVLERELSEPNDVYGDEYLDALAYAKDKMPSDYARFKAKLKGKVNLRDLENCIKAYRKKSGNGNSGLEPLELEGIALPGINIPHGWDISLENGVKKIVSQGDTVKIVIASPVAVVISKRLRNLDSGGEKLEVSFFRDGYWQSFIGQRSDIFSRNGIMKFGDTGLPISTGSAPDLVQYLSDFENANMNSIKCVKSISRVGWISNSEFYPFTQKDVGIEFEPDSTEATTIYKALTKSGDYGMWRDVIGKHRESNSFARFMIAASFASPLIEKIRHRVFFIHFWHDSKSGKTALLKAALSVWGDPMKLISSFNATQVGLERKADALDTLPFAIDELQALNEKRVPASAIVYNIGNGYGKLRGAKVGGLQQLAEWRTIVLTTGEQPITSDSSMDGVQSRVLELYAKMIEDERDGTKLHQLVERNYGHAGGVYMRYIADKIEADRTTVECDYERFMTALEERFGVSGYMPCVAVVCLGDYYAAQSLWNENPEVAFAKAVVMGVDVLNNNKDLLRGDSVLRAWEFVTGWLVSNQNRFDTDSTPYYGKVSNDGAFLVIPHYLDSALEEAGFNVAKSIQGFRDRKLLVTKMDAAGKERTKHRTTINGIDVSVYRFELSVDDSIPKPLTGVKK